MNERPAIVFLDGSTVDAGDIDLAPLRELGSLTVHPVTRPSETVDHIGDAAVVVTNKVVVDRTVMESCPALKLIAVAATGVNNVDLEAARARGIAVCNVAGYSTPSVAQHTIALLLGLATSLHHFAASPAAWADSPIFTRLDFPVVELSGRRLGIAGLGAIGSAVARIARALGMDVKALAREGSSPSTDHHGIERIGKEAFFRTSDAITLHCPLTPDTERLINAESLGWMKPTAFLVNTGRGGLVDEIALAGALRSGAIAGAALDVLSVEPPPRDHPLLDPSVPNLLITPHTAWLSRESRTRLVAGVAENIRTWIATGAPAHRVA